MDEIVLIAIVLWFLLLPILVDVTVYRIRRDKNMRAQFRMGQEILDWDEALAIISRSMVRRIRTGDNEVCGEISDYPYTPYLCMDTEGKNYLVIPLYCEIDGKTIPLELIILRDEDE